ncbi:MAG: LTA synthase family protein [Cyclobacteriaceae bacterium]|nr:LTA synthase family protein [Cyclobacteriaceae bacterium]
MIKSFLQFTQIHRTLLLRFAILMLIYSISRVAFFVVNYSLFQETSAAGFLKIMLGGVKFDLSALLFINAIYVLFQTVPFRFRYIKRYQKFTNGWFWISNSVFIIINNSDIIYYQFILKRTTLSVIKNFENETNLPALFFQFIFVDYWYVTLFLIGLIYGMIWLYKKTKIITPTSQKAGVYYPTQFLYMLILLYFTVIGMRGGFTGTTRPITLNNAGRYVERPKEMAIVLNTPFTIFKTLEQESFVRLDYYNESDLEKIYSPIHQPKTDAPFRPKNVVIFILESFGKEYFGAFNKSLDNGNYQGYTPFFDSLINHSLTFKYSFANGGKSIDGIPSVISSLPSIKGSFVLSNYSTNSTSSLAVELKKKEYHTAFFHGAPNGSMGFLAYTTVNGFNEYYGKSEFDNDEYWDGVWGIWDEEFFQFFAQTMGNFKQPFLSTIFSVSSHHPFEVPKKYKDTFPKGSLPMHQVIGYTDYAIRRFFDAAKQTDWYNNTLFVFTADHTNQSAYKEYKTSLGNRSIPIIFFDPSGELMGLSSEVAQQIDIMPTILSYLNYDEPYFAFGNDLLDSTANHFAVNSTSTYYQLVMDDYFMQFNGVDEPRFFNFKEDVFLSQNIASQHLSKMDSMNQILKAFMQQYNNRMIDNKISFDPN